MTLNYEFIPVPRYFIENGDIKKPNVGAFLIWAFDRCRTISRNINFNKQEIEIEPFEFIFGLETCSDETGISIQQIRTILKDLINRQILIKSTGKSNNKFTVYRWSRERFCKNEIAQSTGKSLQIQQQSRYILHNKSKDLLFPKPPEKLSVIGNQKPLFFSNETKIVDLRDLFKNNPWFQSKCSYTPQSPPDTPTFFYVSREIKSREGSNCSGSSAVNETEVVKTKRSMKSFFDRKSGEFCDIDKKMMDEWKEKFPSLNANDIQRELEKIKSWLTQENYSSKLSFAQRKKRKATKLFLSRWLARTNASKERFMDWSNPIHDKLKIMEETDWENDPSLQLPESFYEKYAQ